jgi:hypothetical protein
MVQYFLLCKVRLEGESEENVSEVARLLYPDGFIVLEVIGRGKENV